jgi:peptidyl-prolyl cis-trans isomerase C
MRSIESISIFALSGLLLGCAQDAGDATDRVDALGPGEVAFVDGNRIPESIFRVFTLSALQANADDLTEEGRAEVIDRLIFLQVLAQEAEQQGLHEERRIAAELELQRMNLLARAVTERFSEENPPTESELRDLYELNLPRLRSPEYKTRHILVETEAEAADLIAQLDQGADFADLAREHSTGPSGPDGGDLGWATADSYVAPFAEAVRAATTGRHYESPVETEFGWHVILVEDFEEQAAPGLEAVRQDLIIAAGNQKLEAYVNGLREAAEVTVVE